MATIEDLVVGIGVDEGSLEKDLDNVKNAFDSTFAKVTAAGAALGVGLEAFARGAADTNIKTRELAAGLGISDDAMRDLVISTANVGFPLQEVLDLMETGKQQGLTSGDALKAYASFWDMVGDASGESATALGKAGTALGTMGIDVEHLSDATAALGFIQEHTTSTEGDFLAMLGRIGPDLHKAGLNVDDVAALLGLMEQQLGLTGRAARTQLMAATKESDGTLQGLLKTLGITEAQFGTYAQKVDMSSGVLQRNSDIVDQSFTPLQKLEEQAKEFSYKYGDLAQVAGYAGPILMGIGPVMKGIALATKASTYATIAQTAATAKNVVVMGVVKTATVAWTAVQWLLNIALDANPIGLLVIGIGLLIAAVVLIAKKTTWFQTIWRVAWTWIKRTAGDVWDWLKALPSKIGDVFRRIGNFISAPFRAAFNFVADAWNNTVGRLQWTVPTWVPFIGGATIGVPNLPHFHRGGIVPGSPGSEMLAVLQAGERVIPANGRGSGGDVVIRSDGSRLGDAIVELIARAVRDAGPEVIGIKAARA
jgi:hypothetical protein